MRMFALIALTLGLASAQAATDPKLLLIEQKLGGFSDKDYAAAVERTLGEFENRTGVGLRPAELRRCGLKLSSESGAGLATPKPLIRSSRRSAASAIRITPPQSNVPSANSRTVPASVSGQPTSAAAASSSHPKAVPA